MLALILAAKTAEHCGRREAAAAEGLDPIVLRDFVRRRAKKIGPRSTAALFSHKQFLLQRVRSI